MTEMQLSIEYWKEKSKEQFKDANQKIDTNELEINLPEIEDIG